MEKGKYVRVKPRGKARKRLQFVSTTVVSQYWGEVRLMRFIPSYEVNLLYPSAKAVVYGTSDGRSVKVRLHTLFKD